MKVEEKIEKYIGEAKITKKLKVGNWKITMTDDDYFVIQDSLNTDFELQLKYSDIDNFKKMLDKIKA